MSLIYQAPKPNYRGREWFKFIVARIVFPMLLLWDLIKFAVNKLVGARIGKKVLPAQDFPKVGIKLDLSPDNNNNASEKLAYEKYEVLTHDGVHLDTLEVKLQLPLASPGGSPKYIINLLGNAARYELAIDDMKRDAQELQANVVGFNFRGVGASTGRAKSANDLLVDGIAQVQRLLAQGVAPENIILKGHSLGAAVASLVAQHFHQQGQPIYLFNSRSFSSLTKVVVGHLQLSSGGRKILLAMPLIKFILSLSAWEINAGDAFKNIPEEYRDYIVVRAPKSLRGKCIDDGVIPHYASIHKILTRERRHKKAQINTKINALDERLRCPETLAGVLLAERNDLVKKREKIKADKKMINSGEADGHNVGWDSLHNRAKKSARTVFREFFQTIGEKKEPKATRGLLAGL